MTLGELARLFNGENKIGADLTVVPMKNWERDRWFDETGLPWINPSPNMRNLMQATLYPGIGAIEYTNISVGRGTDTPFEQIGAPWIDGVQLAEALNARGIPGVRFYPVRFTPTSSKYAKEECQGVFMVVTDRAALRPVRARASRSRRRCTGCTARSSRSRPPSGCSDRRDGARAHQRRRGPGGDRRVLGAGGGALAAAAREVPALSLTPFERALRSRSVRQARLGLTSGRTQCARLAFRFAVPAVTNRPEP